MTSSLLEKIKSAALVSRSDKKALTVLQISLLVER